MNSLAKYAPPAAAKIADKLVTATPRIYRIARDHRGQKWFCLMDVLRALDYKPDHNGPSYVADKLPAHMTRKMPILRRTPRRQDRWSHYLMLCVNAEGKALIEARALAYHNTVYPTLRGRVTPTGAYK